MTLRLKKIALLSKKELRESFKSKEVIWVITLLPLMFAIIMPLTIPLLEMITTEEAMDSESFENFPQLVPYWDELSDRNKFLVFYTMIFFETFLLLPMILPLVIAADSIAGERERKTIESLMASPLSIWEILVGKLTTTLLPSIVITYLSGCIFMLISDLALYDDLNRLLFPNTMASILLFAFSPFLSLITTQSMIIVSTKASGMREAQQLGSLIIIPLYSFIIGETALFILANPWWTVLGAVILLVAASILLVINLKLFDREYMISAAGG